jgi:ribose 5-phosphate isomerase B
MKEEVFIASDHAGFKAKERLISLLKTKYYTIDLGPHKLIPSDDYPDYAFRLAEKVVKTKSQGILICKSGIGMSIAANKVNGARAALAINSKTAKLSRQHNNANILALPAEIPISKAKQIVQAFLSTKFINESRHVRRIKKIENYEKWPL